MELSTADPTQSRSVAHLGALDPVSEPAFDDIVMLASQICGTPVALVSLVEERRQWFKARVGFEPCETPLDSSVCKHTLDHQGLLVIPDLTRDERTRDNPLVTGPPYLRFYAGAPLDVGAGPALGALCVIDHEPREGLEPFQATALEALARQVIAQMELRRAVTEVARRTSELEASEARLRTIFQTTYQVQGLLAPDGTVLDANETMLKAAAAAREEVVGRCLWETPLFSETSGMPERVREWVQRASSGETVRHEIEVVLPGGRRCFDFALHPVRDPDGTVLGIVPEAVDLTDRRSTEGQLRQAQKMDAIGQLTGGIAHDFNNMLAVIVGSLNLLERRLAKGGTDVGRYIDAALDGANRAAALTHRLLAFSRQQPLAPEPVDANRMVADMSELLSRTLGEATRIETVLSAGLWKANADPSQLENVILNLSVNARDAMPDGGRLTIETANAHVDDDYAKEHGISPGQYVLVAVSDTGTGMPPEVAAKAFDPFFTTKGVGKGTGLGLSQVFGFVRQSSGHVRIYSEVGHGTTIKVYLPRFHGEEASKASPLAANATQGGNRTETVMVVEDDPRMCACSVESLRELGYDVVHAASGPEALRMIEAGQDVALLFTDIVMPEMTGRQLADAAMVRLPGLKVLYTTGYTPNAVVHNGVLDAGTHVLVKPFGISQLAAKVRSVLDA
ncbi:ATP-binding protein [Methylobacterium sp. J-078]|uniref:ATP-binding protein n=1 Tax=Methylobacterium sp. J-078 TaxID=2836657 RepID=UPI001FBA0307|nr:ATP-binding protein [Methylobacterium sp. J-078]MCJ2044056.1 ATP-binding protein [Methylobacterium sp. J-078]